MKLKNSTDFADLFLRRMVSWIARQRDVGLRIRDVRSATFRRTRGATSYSGTAYPWRGEIVVRVGPPSGFPVRPWRSCPTGFADQVEALVGVTAHELMHVAQRVCPAHRATKDGRTAYPEGYADHYAELVLAAFREQREVLLGQWSFPGEQRPVQEKASPRIARARRALAKCDEWERKLARAEAKVREWRRRVRYYERVGAYGEVDDAQAATRPQPRRRGGR